MKITLVIHYQHISVMWTENHTDMTSWTHNTILTWPLGITTPYWHDLLGSQHHTDMTSWTHNTILTWPLGTTPYWHDLLEQHHTDMTSWTQHHTDMTSWTHDQPLSMSCPSKANILPTIWCTCSSQTDLFMITLHQRPVLYTAKSCDTNGFLL
jgi:hypothetical protein